MEKLPNQSTLEAMQTAILCISKYFGCTEVGKRSMPSAHRLKSECNEYAEIESLIKTIYSLDVFKCEP